MARKLYTYAVRGSGAFPVDMLRYDQCWPMNEAVDSYGIAVTPENDDWHHARTIELRGLRPPTEARWSSFTWKVVGRVVVEPLRG